MKIAVEGCCHGELDKIYETVAFLEQQNKIKVDLLLICGDFQAVRNKSDLQTMAVPPKYRQMNTFWKYYAGIKKAPVLTVMIGGNHEASNYLQELPYGGWIAHNIYYMGYAGVINCGGVRIGALSGIYKGRDYNRGHFEHPPYSEDTKRSCYHIRNIEVFRLKQVKKPIDIFLTHDWPRGVYNHGNVNALLAKKKFFREEVEQGTLGNPAAEELLNHIKPSYWFSAHLHVKFAALVEHQQEGEESKHTKFLALDKCLPRRKFLQVIDVPSDPDKPVQLELDAEWLCILKSTNHLLNLGRSSTYMPGPGCSERYDFSPTPDELQVLHDDFEGLFTIPNNFEKSVDAFNPQEPNKSSHAPQIVINPQTTLLCEMLSLTNPFAVFSGKQQHSSAAMAMPSPISKHGKSPSQDDSAWLDDSDFTDNTLDSTTVNTTLETTMNPDEISLDELDEACDLGSDGATTSSPIPKPPGLSLPPPQLTPVTRMSDCSGLNRFTLEVKDPLAKRLDIGDDSTDNLNASIESDSSSSSGKRNYSLETDPTDPTDTVSSTTGDESSPQKSKKFKRRNQSLYTNDEES